MNNPPAIVADELQKSFDNTSILLGVSFSVAQGETVSVSGASGSGKSTLLHLLGGLDVPDGGSVSVGGKKWSDLTPKDEAEWRNRMLGFVFQFHLLLPEFSALENAAMPLLIRRCPRDEAMTAAMESLKLLGLESHAEKTPSQMSGGERQRVAVARAMSGRPACILADEPTGNLDRKNADTVFGMMLDAAAENKTAIIVASHDEKLAVKTSRQTTLMDGKLKE